MRGLAVLAAFLLVSGCAGNREGDAPDHGRRWGDPVPANETLYLKAGYGLVPQPPAKATPDRVAATPFLNGFANEDIRSFASQPSSRLATFSEVRFVVFYEVAGPTIDPFPSTSNPQEARAIVFWLGSGGVYPMSVSTPGPTVVAPGRVYEARGSFQVPAGGWLVPKAEAVQLLIATLAVNAPGYELRFLVDAPQTPSRVELVGRTSNLSLPSVLFPVVQSFTIQGNSGMFTGATADRVKSRVSVSFNVRDNDTYLEARVRWRSNAGGKSDLDFTLFAPDGRRTLLSTTPYQNETIRAFAPQLASLGPGNYTAEIEAYSGFDTRFDLFLLFATPR